MARPASPTGAPLWVTPECRPGTKMVPTTSQRKWAAAGVLTEITRTPAVLAQRKTPARSFARKDKVKDNGPSNGAENLRDQLMTKSCVDMPPATSTPLN